MASALTETWMSSPGNSRCSCCSSDGNGLLDDDVVLHAGVGSPDDQTDRARRLPVDQDLARPARRRHPRSPGLVTAIRVTSNVVSTIVDRPVVSETRGNSRATAVPEHCRLSRSLSSRGDGARSRAARSQRSRAPPGRERCEKHECETSAYQFTSSSVRLAATNRLDPVYSAAGAVAGAGAVTATGTRLRRPLAASR